MKLGIDIKAGSDLAIAEMYGDWYRDPWGWPEMVFLSQQPQKFDLSSVLMKEEGEHVLAVPPSYHMLEVPKSRLALRPAVVQDSLSRLVYASAVASNLPALHADLPDWAFGWRYRAGTGRTRNSDEWKQYLALNEGWSWPVDFALQVDIASFFASIDISRLVESLYHLLGKNAAVSVIGHLLRTHDHLSTRSGIPQRSFASAALAHVYLRPLDDALASAAKSGATAVVRWMDDITAVGTEERMYRLFLDLRDRAHQLGLNFNDSKSRLIDAAAAAQAIRGEALQEIDVPMRPLGDAYESGEVIAYDTSNLLRLEEQILQSPSSASRTLIRAVLTSLRRCNELTQWQQWLTVAHQIPHAADSLGRYLRQAADKDDFLWYPKPSAIWDDLSSWFVQYSRQQWGRVSWATSQLALIFPASIRSANVIDLWTEWLEASNQVQMVAIAGQRLASRDPSRCRDIIRGRIDHVTDPVLLRALGLAFLTAGGDRRTVKSILDRDPRNVLVSLTLAERDWSPPPVAIDFDSQPHDLE